MISSVGIIPADAGSTGPRSRIWLLLEDHPRGCGEHVGWRVVCDLFWGSSPRMRGAHGLTYMTEITGRIIPADAGSTYFHCASDCWRPDHPRGCGEHGVGPDELDADEGSSPRMRGALCPCVGWIGLPWIIPADAGSTGPGQPMRFRNWDHPRGCGEHAHLLLESSILRGIIPADAGSTPRPSLTMRRSGDHPRGCGEHWTLGKPSVMMRGSSPRMRGALDHVVGSVG